MSLRVRAEHAKFFPLTLDWSVDHEEIFSQDIFPTDSLERPQGQDHLEWLDAEQELYEEVLTASRVFRTSLASALPMAEGLRVDSLEGAQRFLTRVLGAQAQQRTAIQSFLLTGDTRFRDRFAESAREEGLAMGALRPLGAALSAPIRIHSQRFDSLSVSWHRGLEEKLSLEAVPEDPPPAQQEVAFLQQVADEQEATMNGFSWPLRPSKRLCGRRWKPARPKWRGYERSRPSSHRAWASSASWPRASFSFWVGISGG